MTAPCEWVLRLTLTCSPFWVFSLFVTSCARDSKVRPIMAWVAANLSSDAPSSARVQCLKPSLERNLWWKAPSQIGIVKSFVAKLFMPKSPFCRKSSQLLMQTRMELLNSTSSLTFSWILDQRFKRKLATSTSQRDAMWPQHCWLLRWQT